MLGSLISALTLCTDTFVASLAYEASRTHMDWGKVALSSGIRSRCLGLASGLGNVISSVLPRGVTKIICFVSLFLPGFIKFLDYNTKTYIDYHCCICRSLSFFLSELKVIVNIYGDSMTAGVDGSQSLGWREIVFLALAMSTDGLVAGTMATLLDTPVVAVLALLLAVGVCMIYGGLWLGCKMVSRFRCDLSWVSGVPLMVLVLMKILR